MGDAAKRRATYEDLLAVPDHLVAEILDGELVTSPRPATEHSQAASDLLSEIKLPFGKGKGGPGGWVILFEPELHLGEHVLVPDLAGWRRERMPEMPHVPAVTLAPDWVCEVLSPSTVARDRVRKLPIYAAQKVQHAWLVDANAKTLEVFRLNGESWLLVGTWEGDAKVRAEPFDAVELELGGLWAR